MRVRKELERSQWWAPERLEQYRLHRLRDFLERAGDEVEYYRDVFSSTGFDPVSLSNIEELARLPFLTKADISSNSDRLVSSRAGKLTRFNTGGSTGEPLIFWLGNDRVSHDVAAKWRATRWWGVDIGDPEIVVWGSPVELGAQDRVRAIRDRILRTRLLPAFSMNDSRVEGFLEEICRMRPRMLFGYPSSLAYIARYARKHDVAMHELGIHVAFVTSEVLYEDQRRDIEQVFGCPVANGYGGRDAGFIAHQCPEGGMHITAEDLIVEIVDEQGNTVPAGRAGEVVITHMATSDFPFIRYRTGDVAVLDEGRCPCGRSLPLLKEIHGRSTDFIVAADGTVMHGLALIYIIRDLPGVVKFKIVQDDIHHTRIYLVTDAGFNTDNIGYIRSGVHQRLGKDVQVEIELVSEIPVERSGKFRYVVSHVAP